jgi:outer membrane protein insertion porin family
MVISPQTERLKLGKTVKSGRASLALSALIIACLSLNLSHSALAQQTPETFIEGIEIKGNRRIPEETIRYYIQSKPGDRYQADQVRRDLEAIIALGWFDPMQTRVSEAEGQRGGKIIIFQVREYPIIRDIRYVGLKSVVESEVLAHFKEKHVGLSKESQLNPAKLIAARNAIRELLAEKGHPEATVEAAVEDISPTAVVVFFNVEEGPRVRIKAIEFIGDRNGFSPQRLRRAMKLVKEAGLLASFTSKDIYHKERLQDDLERVRFFLSTAGYLKAVVGEPRIERAGEVSTGIWLPIPGVRKRGPGLKITIPIEVGRRYRIAKVTESGVTLFPPGTITAITGLKQGEIASTEVVRQGVYENIKNLYGDRGYIQADVQLESEFTDQTDTEGEVAFTINVEEGRQFTLRRIEFLGNTHTREVVLRRELLLYEGDPYSKRLWDLSLLSLNRLGLFEEIRERDASTNINDRNQTVDIDLQVKERGHRQINLTGGTSGSTGSSIGFVYSDNNLLGYGESLNVELSAGNRQLYFLLGFTEPYLADKPIRLGLQFQAQRLRFFGSNFFSAGADATAANLGSLFTQRTLGGTVSTSAPLSLLTGRWRKYAHFTRLGLAYSLTGTSIEDPPVNRDTDPGNNLPTYTEKRIVTSRLATSFSFSTLNAAIDPTRGQSLLFSLAISGGLLGGDVRTFSPSLEYKFFKPVLKANSDRPQVLGMRLLAAHIGPFGTPFATQSLSFVGGVPVYERFFLGGEESIRGYNVRSIAPVVQYDSFLSTRGVMAKVYDSSGKLVDPPRGAVAPSVIRGYTFDAPEGACPQMPTPNCNVIKRTSYTSVGGDTQLLYNLEYRVPLVGPVSLAAFADVGTAFNLRRYRDQVVKTDFINQIITPGGVTLNPAGRVATRDELENAPRVPSRLPPGFRAVYLQGDSRAYDIIRLSQQDYRFLAGLRSSLGAELRVQVPMINVPFRLIFAYNPNAKIGITDPGVFPREQRTVVRFSLGRTF